MMGGAPGRVRVAVALASVGYGAVGAVWLSVVPLWGVPVAIGCLGGVGALVLVRLEKRWPGLVESVFRPER